MKLYLSILLGLIVSFCAEAQNQGNQHLVDSLMNFFLTTDEVPNDNAIFSAIPLPALNDWKPFHAAAEERAMAAMVALIQHMTEPVDLYHAVISGREFWSTHQHLRPNYQLLGLSVLNNLYQQVEMHAKRLEVSLRMCELEEELSGNEGCRHIASVYYDMKQYQLAADYFRDDAAHFASVNNKRQQVCELNNLASSYQHMGKADSAQQIFREALAIMKDSVGIASSFGPEYYSFFKHLIKWSLARSRSGGMETPELLEMSEYIIRTSLTFKDAYWNVLVNKNMALWSYQRSDGEKALNYCDDALLTAAKYGMVRNEAELFLLKSRICMLLNKRELADECFLRAETIADSLRVQTSQMQATVGAAQHGSREREKDLQQTRQMMNVAMALADKESQLKKWWIGLFVAVLAVLSLVVLLFRQNIRAKRLITAQSLELENSLHQKDLLMKEIHHRVKNNLQVISSLLELQSTGMTKGEARDALEEGRSRVQGIAILHQQLYQHREMRKIELGGFVNELTSQVMGVFKQSGQELEMVIDIPETMLDIDTALPLGIILNELLTNSFKYAFIPGKIGFIHISATDVICADAVATKQQLIYRDSGTGLPQNLDLKKADTLGLKLIFKLSKQFKGTTEYAFNNGAEFKITL